MAKVTLGLLAQDWEHNMINKVDAIRSLYKGSYDKATEDKIVWKDGHETTDEENSQIDAEFSRLQTEYDSQEYARNRKAEYPSMADQLDDIFHNGIDGWKATIQVTKDKYPKG